jgi:hypothetical protein
VHVHLISNQDKLRSDCSPSLASAPPDFAPLTTRLRHKLDRSPHPFTMDRLRASVKLINTTTYLENRAVQKTGERYKREMRVPPPTGLLVFTSPPQQPPQYGENASYYAAHRPSAQSIPKSMHHTKLSRKLCCISQTSRAEELESSSSDTLSSTQPQLD